MTDSNHTGEADPTIDNPTEAVEHDNPFFEPIWNAIKTWDLERSPGELYANATGTDVQTILDAIKPVLAQAKEAWTREVQSLIVADKEVRFSHTAVNGDMHMFIDNFHNPTVCPECIQPGLLVNQERIN